MNNHNLPAFPIDPESVSSITSGLSKREYFAALAMQGLCANPDYLIQKGARPESLAFMAIETADAVLKQLETK